MAETLAFYAVAPSQGKRTISLSLATILANENYKTLYVELDTSHPSIAIAHGITHEQANILEYFQKVMRSKDFSVDSFVLTKKKLIEDTEDRSLKKRFNEIPDNLEFLVMPDNFNYNLFPLIVDSNDVEAETKAQAFIREFMFGINTANYDFVILNLPNELEHIFGFEMLNQVDKIINVVTPSFARLFENSEALKFLKDNAQNIQEKTFTVLNCASPIMDVQTYKETLGQDNKLVIIPFEMDRQEHEFSLSISSPIVNEHTKRLALTMDIKIDSGARKKNLLGFARRE